MSNKDQHIINALHKLFNSSIIKDVYPMIEDISIIDLNVEEGDMFLNIEVNSDNMNYDNMYDDYFDPFYLVDYHIVKLLPYVGIKLPFISWDVYRKDGKYVAGYEERKHNNRRITKIFKNDKEGNKAEDSKI